MFSRDVLQQRGREVLMNLVRSTCAHGVETGLCGKCCDPYASCRALRSKANHADPHGGCVAGQRTDLLLERAAGAPQKEAKAHHADPHGRRVAGRRADLLLPRVAGTPQKEAKAAAFSQKFKEGTIPKVRVEQALKAAEQKASYEGAKERRAATPPEKAPTQKAHDPMPTTSSSAELLHWVWAAEEMLKKMTQENWADFGGAPRTDPVAGSMAQPTAAEGVIEGSPKQDTWFAGDAYAEQKLSMAQQDALLQQENWADFGGAPRTDPVAGSMAQPTAAEGVIEGSPKQDTWFAGDACAEQKLVMAQQDAMLQQDPSAYVGLEVLHKHTTPSKALFASTMVGPKIDEVVINRLPEQASRLADGYAKQKQILTYQELSAALGLEVLQKQDDLRSKSCLARDTAVPTSADVVMEGFLKQAQRLAGDAQKDQKQITPYQDRRSPRSAASPPAASDIPAPSFAGAALPLGGEEVSRMLKVFSTSTANPPTNMDAVVVQDPAIDGPAYVRVPRLEFM